ncbi:MAG: glyoxalase/bleomycin resistance protein/dioxygenase [Mucilaginibacter sp.]|nr:glyoxalase/bleomycin resistance protein/dioxygenase [Mucilaginibacter sp.]
MPAGTIGQFKLIKMTNEAQIRMLIENWAAAIRNKDIDGILAHHSADLVMFDVPLPFQSVGIDAYRKTWDLFFKYTKPGVFDITELNIIADEQVAFCYATMKCSDKSSSDEFVELPFRLTIGLKKTGEQWVIVHEHHSIPGN